MNKEEVLKIFSQSLSPSNYHSNITITEILMVLIASLLISLIINFTYRKAFFGVLYQRSFGITLIIITVVSSIITIVISGNLALSLGMVGALSIIRYRTAVKDPIDIAFLFWSVAAGISNGIFAFKISIVSTIFISFIIFVLHRFSKKSNSKLLFISLDVLSFENCVSTIKKDVKNLKVSSNIINKNNQELILDIILKSNKDENELLKTVSLISGVKNCSLISKNSNSLD